MAAKTSIWQLTVAERKNAAKFIEFTTVKPFNFMGHTFKCFYCLEYYSDVKTLLDHTGTHRKYGEKDFLQKFLPKGKRNLNVDISDLNCLLCSKNYTNLTEVRTHLEFVHNKQFHSGGNGMVEFYISSKNDKFCCHICNENFYTFQLLNFHMNSHFVKVICENCGAGFSNQHLLMKHKEIHSTSKYNCTICKKVYYKRSQLKYHIETFHTDKQRVKKSKCQLCPQLFKEYHSKMAHLTEAHGITKIFQCHECDANFKTRRRLTEHYTKQHTDKYKCNLCSKCFSIQSKLKQHMRSHSGERNYMCQICKNRYMHKITLRKHMKIHIQSKFTCNDCSISVMSKKELEKHLLVHNR